MSNALFFALAAVVAVVLIGLALVTPQGLGARSPAPFGHPLAPLKPPPTAAPAASVAASPSPAPGLRGAAR